MGALLSGEPAKGCTVYAEHSGEQKNFSPKGVRSPKAVPPYTHDIIADLRRDFNGKGEKR
jgi:hypothetical protein